MGLLYIMRIDWRGSVPYSELYCDTYFTKFGGRGQAQDIFLLGNGLPVRWSGVSKFHIGELGFGVGLNLLETLHHWRIHRSGGQELHYYSLDEHLLSAADITRALSDFPDFSQDLEWLLCNLSEGTHSLDSQTFFHLSLGEALSALGSFPSDIDAWYLDGFAPSKNPEMWRLELLDKVANKTASHGTFSTYTSAGWVRRNLEQSGFTVERATGYGTKRHSLKGFMQS